MDAEKSTNQCNILKEKNHSTPDITYYTLKDVAEHCDFNSCWIVIHDHVYDVTNFLHEHPGGYDVLMENAGTDATVSFDDKGHSKHAKEILSRFHIGQLIKEQRRVNVTKT